MTDAAGPDDEGDLTFDDLLGATLLIGITTFDADETVTDQEQHAGTVVLASMHDGIVIETRDGTRFAIPPALGALSRAAPGDYHLRRTGEVVTDPDFLASFDVYAPGTAH